MDNFTKKLDLRWADLDPNFHVRHSVYYDFGAQVRVEFLEQTGIGLRFMQKHGFGPILFREECVFKKEIRYPAELQINVKLKRLRQDYARFTIIHELTGTDGTLHAILTVDGAWMDTKERKLAPLPQEAHEKLFSFPKTDDFEFYEK